MTPPRVPKDPARPDMTPYTVLSKCPKPSCKDQTDIVVDIAVGHQGKVGAVSEFRENRNQGEDSHDSSHCMGFSAATKHKTRGVLHDGDFVGV